ncbi:hypothetical protein OAG26_00170 [Flavobacteriales bacterium]|nr:hypothetical protein [Flavobacteriales bacterium]
MDRTSLPILLAACFLSISFFKVSAQSAPVENVTSGASFTKIDEAISAASDGDILLLSALTFNESLTISKPITILGDENGGTVIDIRNTPSWGILLSASSITLKNITVLSDQSHQGYGIHSDPGYSNITLREVRVLNNATSGIDLNGLEGPGVNLVEGCEVLGSASGFGLALSSCQNTLVRNFTSSSNGFGDIGVLESAYTDKRTETLTFEGELNLGGPQGDGRGGIVIQSDTTVIDPGVGFNFDIDMQAGLYHQLTGTTTYDGDPLGYVLCSPEVVADLSNALSESLGIDDLLGKNLLSGELEVWPGMSLQVAIDAADSEDVIRVAQPGVYDTELVTISKAITILGPNQGLEADNPTRETEAIFEGGVEVTASNVTMDGIRILASAGKPFGLSVASGVENLLVKNTVIRGWFEEDGSPTPIGLVNEGQAELIDCSLRNWPVAGVLQGGELELTRPIITDNQEGLRIDAANGTQDILKVTDGILRNAGADAFVVLAADATDSLVISGGTANLHRYAFRFDGDCSLDITGGTYTESEEQVSGLDTPRRIDLCEENSFTNPAIFIDACDDPTAVNYEECASVNSDNCLYGGCTDPVACNYSETAGSDDGSCEFSSCSGCLNLLACNYNASATIENGDCEFDSCRGCTNEDALNYEPTALYDDGSCLITGCTNPAADNYDPNANFNNGVCFFYGCTDFEACNYDPEANFNLGTCDYTSCAGCVNPRACNYDETATLDAGDCEFLSCRGCTNPDAVNYDANVTIDDGSCRVLGCMDQTAINYNPDATYNDGTCIYGGCTDSSACNYDPNASNDDGSCEFTSCAGCAIEGFCNYDSEALIHDGSLCDYLSCCGDPAATNYDASILPSLTFGCTYGQSAGMAFLSECTLPFACNYEADVDCEFDSCAGCTDATACNYDPSATLSTSTCVYPNDIYDSDNVDCDGNCLNDANENGTCDEEETLGCTASDACNYNGLATLDDGSCEYTSCAGCTDSLACNYDSAADINDNSCDYAACSGCMDTDACNYDASASIDDDCIFPIDIYGTSAVDCNGDCLEDVDGDEVCDADEILGCTNASACNYSAEATQSDGSCDLTSCAGCMDATACNYDDTATRPEDNCDYISCAGCIDPAACNYNASATISTVCDFPEETYLDCDGECNSDIDGDGICDELEIEGCNDIGACNYSEAATDNDGTCDYTTCAGCTNPGACNHNAFATINDGSCNYSSCHGCTDPEACNYISGATTDDGSCIYVLDLYNVTNLDCGGVCINDSDGDGICDEDELSACTDSLACNYVPSADTDDGSCEFSSCSGCTEPTACNYNDGATIDDGSCTTAVSLYGKDYLNCIGECLNDLDGDGICDEEETGCTDTSACNFDSNAVEDDGSCTYPEEAYLDCAGNCLNDADGDGICDELEISGCEDEAACNFNPNVTEDDGSCVYANTACAYCNPDGSVNNNDDDGDGICNGDDACAGDFNNDGVRTASDVLVVLAAYGCTEECGEPDLDGDGVVTAADVLAMLSYFGTFCPS